MSINARRASIMSNSARRASIMSISARRASNMAIIARRASNMAIIARRASIMSLVARRASIMSLVARRASNPASLLPATLLPCFLPLLPATLLPASCTLLPAVARLAVLSPEGRSWRGGVPRGCISTGAGMVWWGYPRGVPPGGTPLGYTTPP